MMACWRAYIRRVVILSLSQFDLEVLCGEMALIIANSIDTFVCESQGDRTLIDNSSLRTQKAILAKKDTFCLLFCDSYLVLIKKFLIYFFDSRVN